MIILASQGAGSISATGGTITNITVNGIAYKLHTFTSNGTFTINSGADNVDYLIVGGGGSGGAGWGVSTYFRGGNAGTQSQGTTFKGEGSYSVTIGNGGSSVSVVSNDRPGSQTANGNSGGSSSVFSVTASGGSGGTSGSTGGTGAGGSATDRNGGPGADVSAFLGQSAGTTYLGGGGGSATGNDFDGNYASGGIGGGGRSGFANGVGGTANTGSGGGSGWYTFSGGATSGSGGSGIVYIRYQV